MVGGSVIKHLLSDKDSLSDYYSGKFPSLEDVRRRLFLLERQENLCVPDHYHRLKARNSFKDADCLGELLRLGLYRLADAHLELRDNRIYVKQQMQGQWQELITAIPPLVLQMAFLHIHRPLDSTADDVQRRNYFKTVILPNTRNTALPYPYIAQLENYLDEVSGLHDLHMHLNGSTETDRAWADFLAGPDKVYAAIKKSDTDKLVKELIEQEFGRYEPRDLRNLLYSARAVRELLFNFVMGIDVGRGKNRTRQQLLYDILNTANDPQQKVGSSPDHPFNILICGEAAQCNCPIAVEGLMYILVFNHLAHSGNDVAASLFHFYLLILGLCNRLLVQQSDQFGFEQFQKITVNKLRSKSERKYRDRFFQLSGNDNRNIRYLEGRFSPKSTEAENLRLLKAIKDGWDSLLKGMSLSGAPAPQLNLIAHFIKSGKDNDDEYIRFRYLRNQLEEKAQVLGCMRRNEPDYIIGNVVGIDAAASELDTPPEVFAPAFRYLRKQGFRNFTYHAGEEFFHIISGLRAIYEAIVFTGMRNGDRIGHAMAAGVSPEVWKRNIGKKLLIRKGEYLDDLIFVNHLIVSRDCQSLSHKLPSLSIKIHELAYQIYEKEYSTSILTGAWLLRRFCPIILLEEYLEPDATCLFRRSEMEDIRNHHINEEQRALLRRYHGKYFRQRYDEVIEVDIDEFFTMEELGELQLAMLKFMHEHEIVIETLPTSNLRIGHHRDFATYQLWNWVRWEKEGKPVPPIVLGTDDPGIFVTNIYNEYANIYCHMVHNLKYSHSEALEIIKRLDRNGHVYRFK